MTLDFLTHWMITLSVAAFLGFCGWILVIVESIHRKRQKSDHGDARA